MPQTQRFVLHFAQLPFFRLQPPFYADNWHPSSCFSPSEHYHNAKVSALFLCVLFVSLALPPLYAPLENNLPKMCGYLINLHVELFYIF